MLGTSSSLQGGPVLSDLYNALKRVDQTVGSAGDAPKHSGILERLLTLETRRIFSGICSSLISSSGSLRPTRVLVCAACEGEGVTTVAAGLAVSAAERGGAPVLLIDGNPHDPAISKAFGIIANNRTLEDFLTEKPVPVVRNTSIPNLSLVPAGESYADGIPAFIPPTFQHFLHSLANIYSFIIIDGPPVNQYPESAMYASEVDKTLLVVRAGVTRSPVVTKALAKLSAMGCENVEVVLNRSTFPAPRKP